MTRSQAIHLDHVRISGTGWHVPSRVVTNEELVATGISTSCEWIRENLGIHSRHIAATDEMTSDLAAEAGLNTIRNAGLNKNDIELIILATSTPDRKSPSTACITQAKMGIANACPAFDLSAVCSGFVYALTVAAQFVQTGMYERVLVIGADTFSKITDWSHRNCVFFGDGAGAVIVERNEAGGGLFSSILCADGMGANNFTVFPQDTTFTMNGRAVYETATDVLPRTIRELLGRHHLQPGDIAAFIPHQPSLRVLTKTADLLGIHFGTVKTNMDRHANTAGATVPLLLAQVNEEGALCPGDLVVFAAVGAGWTWGAALYRW